MPWFADIRDDFGLNNAGRLGTLSANRVRIATARGAGGLLRGHRLALTPLMLVLTRIGAGSGRAVVEPTHNSLLAD